MDKNHQYTKFISACSLFVGISLFILAFGRIDYNISLLLLDRDSLWGKFFDIFGEQPAFWGLLIGSVIIFFSHKKTIKVWNIFCYALGFIFTFLFIYLIIRTPIFYIHEISGRQMLGNMRVAVVTVSLIVSTLISLTAAEWATKFSRYRKHAILLILTIVTEMLLVNVMKDIWGRPRMRTISGFEEFRYWYEIACPAAGQDYRSFPSGHTANAFTILVYCIFIPEIRSRKGKLFFAFGLLWGSLVAISRVVLGAHFLSDVIAGFYITIVSAYGYYRLLFRKQCEKLLRH